MLALRHIKFILSSAVHLWLLYFFFKNEFSYGKLSRYCIWIYWRIGFLWFCSGLSSSQMYQFWADLTLLFLRKETFFLVWLNVFSFQTCHFKSRVKHGKFKVIYWGWILFLSLMSLLSEINWVKKPHQRLKWWSQK